MLVNLLNNLDLTKYEITLFTLFKEGVNRHRLRPEIKQVYIFKSVFRGNVFVQRLFSPFFLFKYLIRDNYDLIVAYQEGIMTRLISGCRNKSTKKVAWIHIEMKEINEFISVYKNYQEMKNAYENFDLIVGVSKVIVESFEKKNIINNPNLKVLYNTNLTKEITELSKEPLDIELDKNKINLITVGRLVQQKGYDRLLKVVRRLKEEEIKQFCLYIIGTGEMHNELLNYVDNYQLHKYVSFLGFKNNPYKYISSSDLFVCSSYNEGFSTAVSESVILNTPVITTDCSGMRELFGDNEYGYIVENDENSLYEGLKALLLNRELICYYKTRTMQRSTFFSTTQTVQEVENTFDKLLNVK
ncbi:MAG: glycosyltransferase [Clostridia bacterium]